MIQRSCTLDISVLHGSASDVSIDLLIIIKFNVKQAPCFPGLYVKSESKVPEVREPGFQVPDLLGQLPVVQAVPYLCHNYRHPGF